MKPAYVRGVGLWTPGHPGAAHWCCRDPDPEVDAPRAGLLDGPMRRRASALTRMGIEVFEQAARQAGCEPGELPSVWATAHGEDATGAAILEMMNRGEGKLSPTRFHNSVYNAASGYASIATSNRAPSTTLTGGRDLVGCSFLEALSQLEGGAPDVLLVLADEPMQPPFDARRARFPLALAFCLSASASDESAELVNLRRDAIPPVAEYEAFGGLYVSAGLPLLERFVRGVPGSVPLELEGKGETEVWCVDLASSGRGIPEGERRSEL